MVKIFKIKYTVQYLSSDSQTEILVFLYACQHENTKLTAHYKAFCKTNYSLSFQMGGYFIGIFYFFSKFKENHFAQFNTFLETKLENDLISR